MVEHIGRVLPQNSVKISEDVDAQVQQVYDGVDKDVLLATGTTGGQLLPRTDLKFIDFSESSFVGLNLKKGSSIHLDDVVQQDGQHADNAMKMNTNSTNATPLEVLPVPATRRSPDRAFHHLFSQHLDVNLLPPATSTGKIVFGKKVVDEKGVVLPQIG
ncbi:unnamed protein product, partial [Amoebophrya sp. A120]|eukprot:GSA120T00013318001.1